MFQTDSEQLFFSSDGCESPLEKEVIQKLSDEGRFYDFGHRTQINFNNISLLVKNMPIDDPERYGLFDGQREGQNAYAQSAG